MHNLNELFDIFDLISEGTKNAPGRAIFKQLRAQYLSPATQNGLVKLAFDTRRINQEIEYNPRRGLQNYHRSEKFISESLANKIKAFTRLSKLLDQLKNEYEREPQWQDSYTRILTSSVHKGLRTSQLDGDYSDAQPSTASLDYLEELMYVRYRLTTDNLLVMAEDDLRKILLDKDDVLLHVTGNYSPIIAPSDVNKYSYDQMFDKMINTMAQVMSSYKNQQPDDNLTNKLFNIKADSNSPEVERTVTITIKDKIIDKIEKKSDATIQENTIVVDKDIEIKAK